MKRIFHISIFMALFSAQFILVNPADAGAADVASWKNFFVTQIGSESIGDNARYAKQMGYSSIGIRSGNVLNYRSIPDLSGLKFFLVDPHLYRYPVLSNRARNIVTTQSYSSADMDFYNQNMAWKSTAAFPNNLATGWWMSATEFCVGWDFQQQAVIDSVVEKIITLARDMEDPDSSFTFGGYMVDVPRLTGDFNIWNGTDNDGVTLSTWTGSDSSLLHGTITHEYATHSEGMAAYYKKLNTRMKQEFPDAKWVLHPWRISNTVANTDEWIQTIKSRDDRDELTPDMLFQEKAGTEFADGDWDSTAAAGVKITRDRVGISQPNRGEGINDVNNRLYAVKTAINGSWCNFFKRHSVNPATSLTEVYPRLKLIRLIPNWDNLNGI
ncbi:MAG: hypothetical protein AAB268_11070, partial [Elusimicrobiota bacterium]